MGKYGEPWKTGAVKGIVYSEHVDVAEFSRVEFAERAAICVNVLKGLKPEALKELIRAVKLACNVLAKASSEPIVPEAVKVLLGDINKLLGSHLAALNDKP